MARPQKFRHTREELTETKVAEKLGRLVIEIEDLRQQRSKLDEMLAAAYDAVDDAGFEKKFVRKVVALRTKEEGVRRDEEDGLETYEYAVTKGVSLVRTRRKPANDERFDPISGEFLDDDQPETATKSPRKAAEAVSERTAVQVEDETSAEATIEGQPSETVALTVQHDGVNVDGPERAGVTAGETATNSPVTADETVGGFPVAAAPISAEETGGYSSKAARVAAENVVDKSVTGGESAASNSEMDRATEGSFETGSEAAEKGRKATATIAAPVDLSHAGAGEIPATKPLRPHCLRPDNCGGYGSHECFSCKKAAKANDEEEAA